MEQTITEKHVACTASIASAGRDQTAPGSIALVCPSEVITVDVFLIIDHGRPVPPRREALGGGQSRCSAKWMFRESRNPGVEGTTTTTG
jgi:hypothetical protein